MHAILGRIHAILGWARQRILHRGRKEAGSDADGGMGRRAVTGHVAGERARDPPHGVGDGPRL
eukprot:3800765-Prymnesium_polylepis.1